MTVELVRRLLEGELLDPSQVEDALLDSVTHGTALLHALLERSPALAEPLSRELGRLGVATVDPVVPHSELTRDLPCGLCWRLLAVPIRRDVRTGVVEVAAADPLDPHIAEELTFHLGSQAVVVRAPLLEMISALERAGLAPSERPRVAQGREVWAPNAAAPGPAPISCGRVTTAPPNAARSSDPAIPLIRRSLTPSFDGFTRPGVGDRFGAGAESSLEADGEPVTRARFKETAKSDLEDPSSSVLEKLELATEPGEVVRRLLEGLASTASKIAVFAVHAGVYRGRAANEALGGAEAIRAISIPSSPESVLDWASKKGHYLGRVPAAAGNAELASLLATSSGEVYVVPVSVSAKPALLVVLAGMNATGLASERADRLAKAGGAALERILRAKKGPR